MARKQSSPRSTPEDRIVEAALKLAATRGWQDLALADIAAAAKVSLPDLAKLFHSKSAILAAWTRRIDADVLAAAEAENLESENPRDRLFDVLMLRFDALAPRKPALKRIAQDLARDPLAAGTMLRPALQSLGWMLEAAGFDSSGLRGALRVCGLALIWVAVFRVWLDDGEDQAKTMAELDRRLRQAEGIMKRISRAGPRRKEDVAA
ncbi:TetR family transcriptional regulator [Parvibaculum sp.]|uniref:TetR family transcriptional regulator n=1 Tax=Parvibaculum sp. TaxID=2024848 RepID=UPI002CE90EE0|nr:TetR family transcriptional regulator [Parvibaculum sp.]HUD50950.1 TetR family transcriptional regulator [Parvibaculum sp.]